MIQLLNVSKVYGDKVKALSNVSVRIRRGEFVFLVGPSGAGKTTFIRLLIREELPSRGQILVGGKNILRLSRAEIPFLRRNIGVVFQDFRLLENRTAYENIAFALEVLEYPAVEIRKRVPAALEMVGLAAKATAFPFQLSGGEQQRLCITRAMVNNPPLFLADEPTGNLDPRTAWEIMKLIEEINARGTTVVVATHNREIVDTLGKRVITLENGELIRDEERGIYQREA